MLIDGVDFTTVRELFSDFRGNKMANRYFDIVMYNRLAFHSVNKLNKYQLLAPGI